MTNLIDRAKEILERGPDDWEARLAATIEMTSPSGKTFLPRWRGNNRSAEKKLGIFSYPKLKGNVVQDLELNSTRYPLTVYFDGKDHDLDAASFFAAAGESGPWEVIHPVHGFVELQLVSITEQVQPVTSGGITVFDTDWIEPIDPDELATARELRSQTDKAIDDLNVSAAQQFADNISQASQALTNRIENSANAVQTLLDTATSPLFDSLDALNSLVNATQIALQSTITQTEIIADSLSGQIQQLAQLPAIGIGDGPTKLNAFQTAITTLSERLPLTGRPAGEDAQLTKNEVATYELALCGVIGAIAKVSIVAPLQTRGDAITLAETIGAQFVEIMGYLETAQTAFSGEPVDLEYLANVQAFADSEAAVTFATRYLLATAPDLKVERRQTLREPKAPIQIVLEQYGELGENEELYDLFISANGLNDSLDGDGILILDRGTEVITYA